MNSPSFFHNVVKWSGSEKKIARKVYDEALYKQCASITKRAKQMISKASSPADLWEIHDYISEQRRRVSQIYDYRYSRLLEVFTRLLRDGWLNASDLAGLSEDKITKIKRWAEFE